MDISFCEVAKAQTTISLSQNVLSAVLMDYAFINVSICRKEGKNGTVYFPDHFLHFMEFPPYTKRHYKICWQVVGLCRHSSENGFVLRLLKTEQLTLVMSVRLLPYTYAEHKVNSSPTQSKLTWLCAWTVEHTHMHKIPLCSV